MSDLEEYQGIPREHNSILVIDPIEDTQVLFYPDGVDDIEILIPREFNNPNLTHSDIDPSISIVYPKDSSYFY